MDRKNQRLLFIDGLINVVLGLLLLLFPLGLSDALGLPPSQTNFYPTILGAVILGIGLALFWERYGVKPGMRGLGLGGAMAINLCGSCVLIIWLVINPFDLPFRGYVILWSLAVLVLSVGVVELRSLLSRR